jgi:site-specific recombinase XerD
MSELVQKPRPAAAASDRHPAAVYLARLAPGSRPAMARALTVLAELASGGAEDPLSLAWAELRYQHTAALRAELAERYAPATANKTLAALRGVLAEAWRLGLLAAEDYHRAADLPSIRATVLPRGRALELGEVRALLEACARERSAAGTRDAAMIAVLYGAGLRRAEIASLELGDYEAGQGALRVRSGKGRKQRMVYLADGAVRALQAWLAVRGEGPGALFYPLTRVGRIFERRMTGQAVLYMLRRRGAQAKVGAFSPHDLRRTFIGDLLEAGADLSTVQQLAGHATVQTTARYDRRGEATKKKASGLLHVPYVEPRGECASPTPESI